jgi:maltokinase
VGFEQTPEPLAEWHRGGDDLATLRRFLPTGTDGFVLALTSLRDLYSSRLLPEQAGGDFAPEARRLGEATASLHSSLAQAFGTHAGDAAAWADALSHEVERVSVPGVDAGDLLEHVRSLVGHAGDDVGAAVRVHGDFHLGQTMRTDSGWFLLDFEGEPARPLEERRRPASPLRDVAGMMRSFHYAADVALAERGDDVDTELRSLAAAWEARARTAFLDGYRGAIATTGPDPLVPAEPAAFAALLRAFELAKAVYEVGYEQAHRPEWIGIPLEAVQRLMSPAL